MQTLIVTSQEVEPKLVQEWWQLAHKRMPHVHENRKIEWALSRSALSMMLGKLGYFFSPGELVFKGYHQLENLPLLRYSLSHSKNFAAVMVGHGHRVSTLGIDVEMKHRQIAPAIVQKLAHPEDVALTPLETWALKEAAFKALPEMAQEGIWLNSICLQEKQQFRLDKSPFKGKWALSEERELLVAKAWM
jgi:4'-phosphopantetheinyl transferase EntD